MNKTIIFLLVFAVFVISGCTDKSDSPAMKTSGKKDTGEHSKHEKEKTEVYYTCSMHPKVRESKPGKCPICHMNLTKIEVEHSEALTPIEVIRYMLCQ